MKKCTICDRPIESEDAPILVMGAYGNPKCLCDECAADLDTVTLGRDFDEIGNAMERIGAKMSESSADKQTYDCVNGILIKAADRAKAIADGSYDFSLDEASSGGEESFEELPAELEETEEDKELDRQDAEKVARFNKFFDWVTVGVLIGAVGFVIWLLLDKFVFR